MKREIQSFLSMGGLMVGALLAGAIASEAAEPAAGSGLPVLRVKRAFFEKTLETELKVSVRGQAAGAVIARSEWVEYPTELPAPAPDASTGPVLADFRDFKACNELANPEAVKLCFNVMPDVSSVGLNAKEMALEGLQSVLPSGCKAESARLSRIARDDDQFTVSYTLEQPGCEAEVTLSVRSL
ncbi:MAG: hypothetical protein NDJ89_03030 [Oligoflexia bacterium]|nr:hypothetical protein [Oligoflexia bacterium]